MATTTIVVIIVVAVVAVGLAVALVWAAQRKRTQQRHVKAEGIRTDAAQESLQVGQREALADETAAKARAAAAQADVKAAQAAGLQQQAAEQREAATSSRNDVNQEFERADKIDPATPTHDQGAAPDQDEGRQTQPRHGDVG